MADPFRRAEALEVLLGGTLVGAVSIDPAARAPVVEYAPAWIERGTVDLAPLMLPPSRGPRTFPDLLRSSFRGLPGLLADSLPGMFADGLTNSWLARNGVQPGEITAVDRLAYLGDRAMGALRFEPPAGPGDAPAATAVELSEATESARRAVRGDLHDGDALRHLLDISGSAGGARPKVLLATDGRGNYRAGQVDAPEGYEHWLFKLDVTRTIPAGQPTGLGRLEYAYHLMAVDAGLRMQPCCLVHDGDLAHFATRRFDRPSPGQRVHVQSLAAMAHLPPERPGQHSYEQYLQTCLRLRLDHSDIVAAFRQVVFNIAAVNRDDHTKNLAFVHTDGRWRLAPSFDLTFPYDTEGGWPVAHQMTVDGSVHGADRSTLLTIAERAKIPPARAGEVIDDVCAATRRWEDHAETAGVVDLQREQVVSEISNSALGATER